MSSEDAPRALESLLDIAPGDVLELLEETLVKTELRNGAFVTLSPLTYGRGRISLGPDKYTVSEFW